MASTQPAMQQTNFGSSSRKLGKTSSKTLLKKTYCTQFFHNTLSNIVQAKHFIFFNSTQTPWNIHFIHFSISKNQFALKVDIQSNSVFGIFQKATSSDFGIKHKFRTNNHSNCSRVVFIKRVYFFVLITEHDWCFRAFSKK